MRPSTSRREFHRFGSIGISLLLAVTVLAAVACGGGGGDSSGSAASSGGEKEGGSVTIGGQTANDHGTKDVTGSSSVDLEADDFYFEPTILTGSPGQKIEIHVENEGTATHNFSISEQKIDETVPAGKDATVEVTFPKSGTVVYFCKFHQSQGMLGGLEVSS